MSQATKYLLVVGGPTASGKTGLAIALAQHFSTEIISADSRQFYQEMKIGNARPSDEELTSVKHHLIADRSLTEALSAGAFAREALAILDDIFQQNDYAVVVGGSGLFVKALTEGLDEFPAIAPHVRQKVEQLCQQGGLNALQLALAEADPEYYQEVDQQNPARLQRALEVCWAAGVPYSSYRKQRAKERNFTAIYLQPSWPREELYARINLRVELMLAAGLEGEARQLTPLQHLPALQTVGYQEWWPYFAGDATKEEVVALIQQNSRRYAKRQLTWNRRDGYWKHVPQGDLRVALAYIQLITKEKLQLTALLPDEGQPLLNKKEAQKRLGLQSLVNNELVAVADIAGFKTWALINCQFEETASYLAQTTLLHEACHRSEKAVVYMKAGHLPVSFMTANGWTSVDINNLPRTLNEKLPTVAFWQWERSKQEF